MTCHDLFSFFESILCGCGAECKQQLFLSFTEVSKLFFTEYNTYISRFFYNILGQNYNNMLVNNNRSCVCCYRCREVWKPLLL